VLASVIAPGARGVVGKTSVTAAAVMAAAVGLVNLMVKGTVLPATAVVTGVAKVPKVFCIPGCATERVSIAPVVLVPPLVVTRLGMTLV
jgi:hypothetical protein